MRRAGRHLSYANVAATIALVLSMSGAAFAGQHYLVTSTGQLSRQVIAKLHKTGKGGRQGATGARGPAGSQGPQGTPGVRGFQGFMGPQLAGPRGVQGAAGAVGPTGNAGAPGGATAITFSATLVPEPLREARTAHLFSFPGELTVNFYCIRAIFTFGGVEAFAPEGSHADTRMVVTNPKGEPPEKIGTDVEDTPIAPGPEGTTIALLLSNTPAEEALESNRAHLDGTIATPTGVVRMDAFIQVAPPPPPDTNPRTCIIHGSAVDYPR